MAEMKSALELAMEKLGKMESPESSGPPHGRTAATNRRPAQAVRRENCRKRDHDAVGDTHVAAATPAAGSRRRRSGATGTAARGQEGFTARIRRETRCCSCQGLGVHDTVWLQWEAGNARQLLRMCLSGLVVILLTWPHGAVAQHVAADPFPVPDVLRPNVAFWTRVFTALDVRSVGCDTQS